MRVDKKFYNTYDTIDFEGYTYKIPSHYKEYLTLKYGDWSIPVKEWNCGIDERTIVN
jgi:lipopolysaccharide cholinephosphotransferase